MEHLLADQQIVEENPIASLGRSELKERHDELQKKIMTMRWDLSHNQLHMGKKRTLDALEKELGTIQEVLVQE